MHDRNFEALFKSAKVHASVAGSYFNLLVEYLASQSEKIIQIPHLNF
jgi:hypothetical protein